MHYSSYLFLSEQIVLFYAAHVVLSIKTQDEQDGVDFHSQEARQVFVMYV